VSRGNGTGPSEPPDQAPAGEQRREQRPESGLARERTDLAWTRSAIAFFAIGVAILKIRPAVGIPVMAVGVVIWLAGHAGPQSGSAGLGSRRLLLVTVAVTGLAVLSIVLTLAGPSSRGLRP
jgi:uncharacterized membrane protein YidH (DUF202 family)